MDLLADADDLEVQPDPQNPQSFMCAGLQRVPISDSALDSGLLLQDRGFSSHILLVSGWAWFPSPRVANPFAQKAEGLRNKAVSA